MSATTPERDPLDLETILAQIARAREETLKFAAEQHKLTQEARKIDAEHDKLRRDRNLAPWLIGASLSGGVVARQIIQHFWK